MPDQTEVIDDLPAADEAADEAQFEAAYAEITGKAAPQEAVTEDPEAEAEPADATDALDASAADKAAPESNPENIEQPDPLAGVPDPVKQEFERLRAERDYLNQFRASQVGREAAHQRQIAELQRQLDGVSLANPLRPIWRKTSPRWRRSLMTCCRAQVTRCAKRSRRWWTKSRRCAARKPSSRRN